ncbi:carbohydrate ABC transporter permease [Phycicoccus sp. Soil802]|uniref:carbohydrate ABC transporter permease n=1 Tax=Phycicoccus sp. Soil802 TaxID=1736414 RepID=UPI00070262FD|nr:sugar ABC transporter permease [Phycicoccus sp. Soil802]KRF29692.1 ABC transporter permease [Phycicoccus sp. Soil802]
MTVIPGSRRRAKAGGGIRGGEAVAGWLFTAPMMIILGLFLFIPIVMALYVSFTNWNGNGSPFNGGTNAEWVGTSNYTSLFTQDGLKRANFMQSLNNNFWYVLFVVPLQTAVSFFLALIVSNRFLKGKGFFRTAFYFPSVTSSIAISVVFLFLFANSGAVNAVLSAVGIKGPAWFSDSRGLFHIVLGWFGAGDNPGWGQGLVLGRSVWDWFAGPSVAMCVVIILAVWTTTGTFMLMFLAALQDVPVEVEEAAMLDGATGWQKLRHVTIPMLKPAFFLVTTLGLIGTWQLFDQIYVMGKGAPANTTLTPAYLSYKQSFTSLQYGSGAAMSFIVFVLIVVLTAFQRWLMRDKDIKPRRRFGRAAAVGVATQGTGTGGVR